MARRTRRTRCWSRKNKKGKRYVVCNRSRGQKKVYRKKRKTRGKKKARRGGRRRRNRRHNRRRTRRRQRGGALMPLSPSAFPPGGPYVQGGATNGLGKGYYYKNNTNPYLPDPRNLNNGMGNKIVQKGGGYFFLENIPGATDIRDVVWKAGNAAKNTYQTWIGGKAYPSPSPSVQPIGEPGAEDANKPPPSSTDDNIPQTYLAAQDTAAQYTA